MRRFLAIHVSRTSSDGWLLWLVFVLGALVLALAFATTAAAATAYYSFTGTLINGTERQSYLFNLDRGLPRTAPFSLRTWHYNGTPFNAAGDPIDPGGFDPILRLYGDTPPLFVENDDGPTGLDSLINWSTSGMPESLAAGDYRLDLVAYGSDLGGRDGHWAVDLEADAAKFTLTGVDQINNTGATIITSLTMGSDDVRVPARLELGPLESLSISDPLTVGNTGAGEVTVTTGSLASGYGNLGQDPGSLGSLTLQLGGNWVAEWAVIGYEGEGNLRVESGGTALFNGDYIFESLYLGYHVGSNGDLTVTGENSTVTANNDLYVGLHGVGTVRVEDRGQLDTAHVGPYGDSVGHDPGGHGTVEVDGKGSLWSTDRLAVGNSSQGIVRITNGGKIATAGNAYIGRYSSSHDSSMTLAGAAPDGTPSTWQISGDLYIAGNESGPSFAAESHLTINPGGLVDVTGTTTYWESGGWLELHGGTLRTGALVKGCGIFDWTSGTLDITNSNLVLDSNMPDSVFGHDLNIGAGKSLALSYPSTPSLLLAVGMTGDGSLMIEGGGALRTGYGVSVEIGLYDGSTGTVTVIGTGSMWTVEGGLDVGGYGNGTLNILAGGKVVHPSGVSIAVARSDGVGTVTVDGDESLWDVPVLDLGTFGDAHLTISNGGRVTTGVRSYLGLSAGSSAQVLITGVAPDGTPSTWDVGGLFVGGTIVGPAGTATVTVSDNGLVTAGNIKVWQPGTVELLGSQINTGSFIVEPGGTFTHEDGTLTVDGGTFDPGTPGYILDGAMATSNPVLELTNGAVASISGNAYLGMDNHAQVKVYSGAQFMAEDLSVGRGVDDSAYSAVLVSGHNSVLVANGWQIQIGSGGRGRLDVLDEGNVTAKVLAIGWTYSSEPHGYVRVEGSGSGLDIGIAGPGVLSGIVVGIDGPGELHILDGAAAESRGGETSATLVGQYGGAHGILEIRGVAADGSRSRLSVDQAFEVGQAGRGDLFVEDGGLLTTRDGYISAFAGSAQSQATVRGSQSGFASTWNATSLRVGGFVDGPGAEGKLTVADGGQVTAGSVYVWQPGTVELDAGLISTGSLELAGGRLQGQGTVSLTGSLVNAGVVAAGLSPGLLNVSGNYVQQPAGTLAIELGGTGSSEFDRLRIVNGSATLGGLLDVSLIDLGGGLFAPRAGDSFEILTAAGGVIGMFDLDHSIFPYLNNLYWEADDSSGTSIVLRVSAFALAGDYNQNGVVDAADYTVWRDTLGSNKGLPNDPIGGTIGQAQYVQWKTHFGQTAGSGSAGASPSRAGVPEPATIALLSGCLTAVARMRRRRSK